MGDRLAPPTLTPHSRPVLLPAGSAIRYDLATLFHTWSARGLNPFAACLAALQIP
ncbi:MAG TPA: hypothetical protein VNL35_08230 [Chloroflexota bacterium]|nr:hypothetical protein [Chloroflexota bacterium]